uniref:Uncharacterized protein n=1 Tax=viral metagenome TaxID=1070528 RepID=A0A6C0J352_9ZZZZ
MKLIILLLSILFIYLFIHGKSRENFNNDCCLENCNSKPQYLSKKCKENLSEARYNFNTYFDLQFTEEEFDILKAKIEDKYSKVYNEIDLTKIKLDFGELDDSTVNKIINDTTYEIPGEIEYLY